MKTIWKILFISLLLTAGYFLFERREEICWILQHFWARFSLPKDPQGIVKIKELGGSGFVELCTGFNIALVSVREFRDRLRFAEATFSEFSDSSSSSILDASKKQEAARLYDRLTDKWKKANEAVWKACFLAVAFMTFLGGWMLYTNQFCSKAWFLITPFAVYLVWMGLSLVLLWLLSFIVGYVCNALTMNSPQQDIQDLDSKSKQDAEGNDSKRDG